MKYSRHWRKGSQLPSPGIEPGTSRLLGLLEARSTGSANLEPIDRFDEGQFLAKIYKLGSDFEPSLRDKTGPWWILVDHLCS